MPDPTGSAAYSAEQIAWAKETVAIALAGGGPTADAASDEFDREYDLALEILYGRYDEAGPA